VVVGGSVVVVVSGIIDGIFRKNILGISDFNPWLS